MSTSSMKSEKQPWYKSPWVIGWILLVLIVLSVNSFMIYQSINDYPGLVVDDFYDRGQNYEENILTKLENNERWKTQFYLPVIHINETTEIKFSLQDQSNNPVQAEQITLYAYRPADAKKDFSTPMAYMADQSIYKASLVFKDKGKWDLLASAVIEGTEVNYAASIFVKD